MDTSIVLAQILGIILAVVSLSVLFNKKITAIAVSEMVQNKGVMWITGFLALVLGAIVLAFNNIWSSGLASLVTVVGWLALIKGTFILVFPKATASFYAKMSKTDIFFFSGIVGIILSAVLLYGGFM